MVELKNIFTTDKPLGPEKIEKIEPVRELLITDNVPYKGLMQEPNIIVGRRGSGKSSIIKSYYLDDQKYHHDLIYTFPIETGISAFITDLNPIFRNLHLVENVYPVWKFIIWAGYLHHLVNQEAIDSPEVDNFLSALKIDPGSSNEDSIFKAVDVAMLPNIRPQIIDKSRIGDHSLDDIISIVNRDLTIRNRMGIILFDSLEHLKLDIDAMHPALAGFLASFAEFSLPASRVRTLCCIPAEVYFPLLEEISSAPVKDFSDMQILHWSAREILQIVAQRLKTFILLHGEHESTSWANSFNLNTHRNVNKFFYEILPNAITNGVGISEDPLAYIMRHTQLLPRHAMIYMNAIFRGLTPEDIVVRKAVNSERIVKAIHENEAKISNDIIDGFRNSYSHESEYIIFTHARKVCEGMLKHLDLEFTYNDFIRVYDEHVKGEIYGIFDYRDAMRVLVELGAIGRSVSDDTTRYKRGLFEYTSPHKLVTKQRDKFLIHPCFVGAFGRIKEGLDFAVYPFGADPDEKEYRHWSHEAS